MKRDRDDAQARFEKSTPILGGKTTFLEAYPNVEELELQVSAIPVGFGEAHNYHYSLANPPSEFCPCPNRSCSGGGYDIGYFLYSLIRDRKTEGESSGGCVGGERIGRGSRSCIYRFRAKARIRYRD